MRWLRGTEMTFIYLLAAFTVGFALACWLARSEMERLADQLTDTRNRLFACGRKLAEATRHLHGERG